MHHGSGCVGRTERESTLDTGEFGTAPPARALCNWRRTEGAGHALTGAEAVSKAGVLWTAGGRTYAPSTRTTCPAPTRRRRLTTRHADTVRASAERA
jgi:hypothetical protein